MEYIWKDRKRYLGLPLSFTQYSLSEDRIFLETGFLTTNLDEILLYRIRDIGVRITLWQRIFGVGSVMLVSSDKSTPELELKNIKSPREVKELIHKQVEEMKMARRMRIGEVIDDGDDDEDFEPMTD